MSRKRRKEKVQLSPVVVVSWVCSRDYPLLPIHQKTIRRLSQDITIIYVWDKTEKDAKPPIVSSDNTMIIGSDFDRQGNLNDKTCITQMIDFYARLVGKGVKKIIKCDCDTIITDLGWAMGNGSCGFHCANHYGWTGCCYCLDAATITGIQGYLHTHDIQPRTGYKMPEDQVITMLAAMCGKINIIENTRQWQCVGFSANYRNNPEKVESIRGVIHCGQWQRIDALRACGLDRTDIVRGDMVFTLRALEAGNGYKSYFDIPCHSVVSRKKS